MNQESFKGILTELSNFDLFKDSPTSKIEKLCLNSQICINKHRQKLFQFGDDASRFGIVLSGAYKLSRPTPSGEDSIMYFSTPGDVIGALIMGQPKPKYPVSATAMGPSRFLSIPKENYIEFWKEEPDLIFRIQNLLSTRMHSFQSQKAMQKSNALVRVAETLLVLTEKSKPDDLQITIPLTRKEIADNLGLTVESVIRIMSELSKQEIITTTDQIIKILKPEKLLELIKVDG